MEEKLVKSKKKRWYLLSHRHDICKECVWDRRSGKESDRGRKASKVVAVVDERGLPHRLGFLPANVSD